MTAFSYLTILAPSSGIYKEKGSKFLAFALPVDSEEKVKEHLKMLKKDYFDSRHQGYAYRLGAGMEKSKAYDDGEPAHSTGDPILGQIKSRNLTNVLVVVVRYFGGVKLGVGGLTSAYKTAAGDALTKAVIIEKEVMERFEILYDYGSTPETMRLVKEFGLIILSREFNGGCRMTVEAELRCHDLLFEKIKLLRALGTKIELTDS